MKKFLCLLLLSSSLLAAPAHLSVGGGYWMAGSRHTSGLIQFEYKSSRYFWHLIRPQACLVIPEMRGVFFGVGIALELYLTEHLIFCPNFSPGLYYRGKARNLGYPLEFRSAVELAYEFNNKLRIGTQFWHVSNASLGDRNPGANAWTLYLAIPLKLCY